MDPDPMDIAVAVIVAAVPLVVSIGGLIIGALAVRSQARIKTLTHQERLAMIERGLTPPPTASLFDTIGIPGPAGGSVDDLIKLKAAKQRLKDDPTHRRDSAVRMLGFGSAAALLFWVAPGLAHLTQPPRTAPHPHCASCHPDVHVVASSWKTDRETAWRVGIL